MDRRHQSVHMPDPTSRQTVHRVSLLSKGAGGPGATGSCSKLCVPNLTHTKTELVSGAGLLHPKSWCEASFSAPAYLPRGCLCEWRSWQIFSSLKNTFRFSQYVYTPNISSLHKTQIGMAVAVLWFIFRFVTSGSTRSLYHWADISSKMGL